MTCMAGEDVGLRLIVTNISAHMGGECSVRTERPYSLATKMMER